MIESKPKSSTQRSQCTSHNLSVNIAVAIMIRIRIRVRVRPRTDCIP